ncbi:MAG TPA: recombinase family protein [Thermoleophilaceae bacterium]|nr:recombinase family protein [Thermoleophilaceae bacterium]
MPRRVTASVLAGLLALSGLSVVPAVAQDREQTPTDLWNQYPLEETAPEPQSDLPGNETSPPPAQQDGDAPRRTASGEEDGGSSVLPIAAAGAAALAGAALLLWLLSARVRTRDEKATPLERAGPKPRPSAPRPGLRQAAGAPAAAPRAAPLTLAAAPAETKTGLARETGNGAAHEGDNGSEREAEIEAEREAEREREAKREDERGSRADGANGVPVDSPERRKPQPEPEPAEPPDAPSRPAEAPDMGTSRKPFRGRPAPAAQPSMTGVGYTTVPEGDDTNSPRLREEARQIQAACKRHGVALKKLVRDLEPQAGPDLRRPGLTYALESLEAGEFDCLVVPRLDRLTRSAANLGALIRLLDDRNARLIVVDIDLDTKTEEGRLAADALVKVGGLERTRLEERTRKGLEAARDRRRSSGRPAVADRPSLKQRIADMRAGGMTLQAIADTLNDEGIPTVRGGAEWRPSSVQAAAGYKRPSRRARAGGSPPKKQPGG